MENSEVKIAFLGREFGEIVREKLEIAGFQLVDSKSQPVHLIVVGFYGKILSKEMLNIPEYGALNVHPSLLPKYRGPAPVPATILNDEKETGVTIILMDEQADHGPILASTKFEIRPFGFAQGKNSKLTTPQLSKILWELGGDLLIETIPRWIRNEIAPKEQDHSQATYTKKLTKEDGRIDWKKPAEYIERQVRALHPWPGTFTYIKFTPSSDGVPSRMTGQNLKILESSVLLDMEGEAGKTFQTKDGKLAVYTGKHALLIEELQLEGGKSMNSKEFLLGHRDFVGTILQ